MFLPHQVFEMYDASNLQDIYFLTYPKKMSKIYM